MKKIILSLILSLFFIFDLFGVEVKRDINSYGIRNGRLLKEDQTTINEADILTIINSSSDYRKSFNTVFGEKIVGFRKASIASQFVYALNPDSVSTDFLNGGTADNIDSMLQIESSIDTAGYARIQSKENLRYLPGCESYCFFTAIFTQGKINSYQRTGLFDESNGFFIGFEEDQFGVSKRRNGITTFYPIMNSQLDEDFNLDVTKGNVYRITFGYLGFATVSFDVMKPDGSWIDLYKIEYPNNYTETHIANTYLPIRAVAANDGNTSNTIIKIGSVSAGIVNGSSDTTSRNFSFADEFAQDTGQVEIVAFRNKSTFTGKVNKISSLLSRLTTANLANKPVIYRIIKNPTVLNTPTWTDVKTDISTLEYSTDLLADFTSFSSTDTLLSWVEAAGDNTFESILDDDLLLFPGETALFFTDSTANTFEVDFGISWKELF